MAKDFPEKLSQKAPFVFLVLIVLLAAFLRFYRLGEVPVSLSGDEVDIAYNSFSLLKTGRDVSGRFLPVSLKTLIDTKPGLLAYLLMVPIRLGGLTELSIRFLPALFGLLTVPLLYFLVKELFSSHRVWAAGATPHPVWVSLIAALLLAISPWHLHLSRGVFEAMLANFLILLGVVCFLVSLRKPKFLLVASLSFGFSLYAYHATKLIVPLFSGGLIFFYLEKIKKIPRSFLLLSVVLFFLLCVPEAVDWFTGPGQNRLREVTIFKNQDLIDQIIIKRAVDGGAITGGRLFHNKLLSFGKAIFGHYLISFSPQFLFLSGDLNPRHQAGGFGQFYAIFFLFGLVGFYSLLKKREPPFRFLLFWLLTSPLASVITIEGGDHAVRLLAMVFPLVTIMAFGFFEFWRWSKKSLAQKGLALGVFLLIILDSILFFHQYFGHWPSESWRWWQYGYKQAIVSVQRYEADYDLVLVNNSYEPAILWFLFWSEYDPVEVQKNLSPVVYKENIFKGLDGFNLGKFWFVRPNDSEWKYGWVINLLAENKDQKILFLASHEKDTGGDVNWGKEPPTKIQVLETIYSPDNQPIFYLLAAR